MSEPHVARPSVFVDLTCDDDVLCVQPPDSPLQPPQIISVPESDAIASQSASPISSKPILIVDDCRVFAPSTLRNRNFTSKNAPKPTLPSSRASFHPARNSQQQQRMLSALTLQKPLRSAATPTSPQNTFPQQVAAACSPQNAQFDPLKFACTSTNSTAHIKCPICLTEETRDLVCTRCGHVFCRACIVLAIEKTFCGAAKCPVCRSKISTKTLISVYI